MVSIPDTLDARNTLGQLEECVRRRRADKAEDLLHQHRTGQLRPSH
jgi:hypothetical protein